MSADDQRATAKKSDRSINPDKERLEQKITKKTRLSRNRTERLEVKVKSKMLNLAWQTFQAYNLRPVLLAMPILALSQVLLANETPPPGKLCS
jgi:hypothetical protein